MLQKERGEHIKIRNLTEDSNVYTSNVYLITGTNNALADVNTLIDVGRDPGIFDVLPTLSTGVGKCPVEQVIITHNHYDHTELLKNVAEIFHPRIYAFSSHLKVASTRIKDGEKILIGDRYFEIIHAPGHSSDSVCLFCHQDGVLFVGDTPVIIRCAGETYIRAFLEALERICQKDVRTIYFGHGAPKTEGCNKILADSLNNVLNSTIID